MLQVAIQSDLDKIIDIQTLGRGCYQFEFENGESVSRLLLSGTADLKGALAVFYPWRHGFNTLALQENSAAMFTCMAVFPNLEKELVRSWNFSHVLRMGFWKEELRQ